MRVVNSRAPIAIIALLAAIFTSTPRAHADTYQLFNLGEDNGMSFLGLNSSGQAFFESIDPETACDNSICYYTFFDGVITNTSSTAPIFTVDDGTPCSPSLPPGWQVDRAVCNNGHLAWTGSYDYDQPLSGVYFNTNPTPPTGEFGGGAIFMDSVGDVILDDGFNDNWWMAVDLTTLTTPATPEPGSLVLLATGILALAITRRRILQNQPHTDSRP